MSVDDFQTKYATVMESVLNGTVAETTKLFETMVDELKAEISRVRKENDDLKARCSRFESARSGPAVCTGQAEPPPGRKRDTAVQCDLAASHILLAEQSQPLSLPPLQSQNQHSCWRMVDALQDHNYEMCEYTQMAFTFIKQEQEEKESTVSAFDLSDGAESTWSSCCGIENEGPFIDKPCSNGEMSLPQRHKDTQMALEPPCLRTYNGLQGPENQPSQPGHSLVTSLPEVNGDMDEDSNVSLKISEIHTKELISSEEHHHLAARHQLEFETIDKVQLPVVLKQCQSEDQMSENEQTNVTLQQYGDVQSTQEQSARTALNKGEACVELSSHLPELRTSSQPEIVRCRRGRPPKRAKYLQRRAKETLQPLSHEVLREKKVVSPQTCPVQTQESLTIITPPIQERQSSALNDVNSEVVSLAVSVVSQLSKKMKGGAIQDPSTLVSFAGETNTPSPQAASVQTTECSSSVTLQDAMLLLDAMNQSVVENVENALSCPQRMTAALITQRGPCEDALKIVDETSAQTPLHPAQTHECEDNLPRMEMSTCLHTFTKSTDLIKTVIPRQGSAEAPRKKQSQTIVLTAEPDLTKFPSPSKVSSFVSASQESSVSAGAQTVTLSQKRDNTADRLESAKQTVSISGIHECTETSSTFNMSYWPVSTSMSPAIPPTFEQKLSCAIRLTRLPFPISTKDTVFVSRLSTNAPWNSRFILKEGTIQEKLSSHNVSTQPEGTSVLSPDICPGSKETSVVSVSTSEISEKPNYIQEKLLASENFTALQDLPDNEFVQPSTLLSLPRPVFEKSEWAANPTEPSAVSGTASNVDKNKFSMVQDCSFPIDRQIKEKQPATLLHPRSVTFKVASNPDSQLTKSQVLEPLLVSPVAQDPEKTSSNESVDARASCAGSSTSDKKRLHQTPLMGRLRSHSKTHLQAKMEANPDPHTETRRKKPKLENNQPNQRSTTSEHIRLSAITSTNRSTLIGRKMFQQCEDDVIPKRTASELSSVVASTSKANMVSSGGDVAVSNNKKYTFSIMRSTSAQGSSTHENTPKLSINVTTTNQVAANHGSCEARKKCTTTAVWIPPADDKASAPLPAKKEPVSPRPQGRPLGVYPPSVPLHPIPIKAPPVISPLQPLSVIGGRLLRNQCGECGRVLSSSAALESHVSLHRGSRPFSCSLCGKSFMDSKGLKRHGRAHCNGRVHVCQHCGKGFFHKFTLTKHIQMVHKRLRPFVCQICNKGCLTKADVESHIRVHTGEKPFHCNLCERKFARRSDLNLHLRWHNGEKRYWCSVCGKGFLVSNNLKRHKYIHTGEKPHSCPHCAKQFTQSGHLTKHLKNVHRVK